MSDRTVSWIVAAAFAGAMALLVATGCASTPTSAKPAAKARSVKKAPNSAKTTGRKVCGWGDTGRWECHDAAPAGRIPAEEDDEADAL